MNWQVAETATWFVQVRAASTIVRRLWNLLQPAANIQLSEHFAGIWV